MVKNFVKQSLRILGAYSTAAAVFTFFVIAPLSMENNQTLWLLIYSFAMFAFAFYTVSKTAFSIGRFEKYDEQTKPFALKGAIYGFVAMIPYMIFGSVHLLIFNNSDDISLKIFHYAYRCAMGPMYFIINTLNYNWLAFTTAYLVVPVISAIWYFAGYKGVDSFAEVFKKKEDLDFLK